MGAFWGAKYMQNGFPEKPPRQWFFFRDDSAFFRVHSLLSAK
jgi:hypothetical protein